MNYRFKIAFFSFIFSFFIMFPIGVFVAIKYSNFLGGSCQTSLDKVKFVVNKEQDLNILFVNYKTLEGSNIAEVFVLMKISAHDGSISLLPIPSNLRTVFQAENCSLRKSFMCNGISYVKKVVENFFDIKIDRTILADDAAVKRAITCLFGGLKIEPKAKEVVNLNLPIIEGKKIIGGDYFCDILKRDPVSAFKLLKFGFQVKMDLFKFFADFFNLFETDISLYDFKIRQKGFKKLISKQDVVLVLPKLELKTVNNHHVMSKFSKISCFQAFKK